MKHKNSNLSIVFLLNIILAFLSSEISAQSLTLDQLILFQKKDVSEINDILVSKGWVFSNSTDETDDNYGITKWSYDKNKWEEGKAQAWLTQSFAEDCPSRIVYQISSKQVYVAIKQSITSYGMKKIESKVGENIISTVYQGKNYIVRIESLIGESNDNSYYIFSIFTKDDYEEMALSKLLSNYAEFTENDNSASNKITDIDGNEYTSVRIGTQTWMVENLKVTRYRNGDLIDNILDDSDWSNTTNGAWCLYKNMWKNDKDYGKLYNWFAVNDSRKIAPIGWHVPSDNEVRILINYLGGEKVAMGKLMLTGTLHWKVYNSDATNSTRFSALPGGCRNEKGSFNNEFGFSPFGNIGHWWCSTNNDSYTAHYWYITNFISNSIFNGVYRASASKLNGYSIRCIKD